MSEWFNEPVLKTGDPARDRGFESHTLRQDKLTSFDKKLVNFFVFDRHRNEKLLRCF